jgi:hypothetical protein
MAALWEGVNEQRAERGLTWNDVRDATGYAEVERICRQPYGIAMHDAMNVVRWLGRPAATFMYAAELSPARPGSAAYGGPERAEAERSAPSLGEIYRVATLGKTDQEIAEFARSRGGFSSVCYMLIRGLSAIVSGGDYEIAMDLGDGLPWTFRRSAGRNSFVHRAKKTARSVLRASPADFMRLVFQDLDPEAACASGRLSIQGEVDQVITFFRSLAP